MKEKRLDKNIRLQHSSNQPITMMTFRYEGQCKNMRKTIPFSKYKNFLCLNSTMNVMFKNKDSGL